jgi:hypothetical protein
MSNNNTTNYSIVAIVYFFIVFIYYNIGFNIKYLKKNSDKNVFILFHKFFNSFSILQ